MKKSQIYWAKRQQDYIQSIESDLEIFDECPYVESDRDFFRYARRDSIVVEVPVLSKTHIFWKKADRTREFTLQTSIAINGLKDILASTLKQEQILFKKVVDSDFIPDNCHCKCFGTCSKGHSLRNSLSDACSSCEDFTFREDIKKDIINRNEES